MTTTPRILSKLYEIDFLAWTERTVQLIRGRQFGEVDWEAVIEEIESLGKSDRRELKSRLEVLLHHLLKWQYQANLRSGSWQNTIDEQRNRIADLLEESPSLKSLPNEVLAECYRRGKKAASNETGLPLDRFPVDCPYPIIQVIDPEFLPEVIDF